jgi:P-type conjugative transfer protein TrbG
MKNTFAVLLIVLAPIAAYAAPADNPDDSYFSKPDPDLTDQEQAGLALNKQWKAASGKGLKPTPGPDGSVNFLFGASQPSIVCAVMQVCDIELQSGEQVNSIHLGDAARWTVEPAITGYGGVELQHLIVKPMDVGLSTSLIVTTNRRTYHLRLRSTHYEYMPRVTFTYLEEAMKKLEVAKAASEQEHDKKTIPETGEYLGNLDFNYQIDGKTRWKPLRVYNDGHKTILEMPSTMSQTEAPTLLVMRKDGDAFNDAEQVMVNYRVQSNRYIVDNVFDKAILVSGVGDSQDRVTITREQ